MPVGTKANVKGGDAVKLTDEGVRFIVNDYDGRHVFWTPEDNMAIALKLGSDICMQLDQCPGYPATRAYVERAVELSSMWAERCYKAHTRDDQALFGISTRRTARGAACPPPARPEPTWRVACSTPTAAMRWTSSA